jgi:hypothetical protein
MSISILLDLFPQIYGQSFLSVQSCRLPGIAVHGLDVVVFLVLFCFTVHFRKRMNSRLESELDFECCAVLAL